MDSVAYSIDVDQVVITAQNQPTTREKSVRRVNVIGRSAIERLGAVTLDQALKSISSVRLINDPVLGTSIRMRGFSGNNISILKDGVPLIGRNNGSIDLSQVALHNVERIEVVEGPLSSIYGNHAAGGVINLITKRKSLKLWNGKLSTQLESRGLQEYSSDIGSSFHGFSASIYGRYFTYHPYPSDSMRVLETVVLNDSTKYLTSKYPFNPKDQYSYGGHLGYTSDAYKLGISMDRNTESLADYGRIRRPTYKPYANDVFFNTARNDVSIDGTWQILEPLSLKSVFSKNYYQRNRANKRIYLDSLTYAPKFTETDSIHFDQILSKTSATYDVSKAWMLNIGYSYRKESGRGGKISLSADSTQQYVAESALYSVFTYRKLKNIKATLSGRFTKNSKYSHNLTGSVNLRINIAPKLVGRFSIARGNRSPSLKELYLEFIDINHHIIGNQYLKPEHSYDIQSTLDYKLTSASDISINTYYAHVENRISLAEYSTLKYRYENIGKYTVFGIQPSWDYLTGKYQLKASGSLGWWSTDIVHDGHSIYGMMYDTNIDFMYHIEKYNTSLSLNYRYNGKQPLYHKIEDKVTVYKVNGYHMIDFTASKQLFDNSLRITTGVKNLLDIRNTDINGAVSNGAHSTRGRHSISSGKQYFIGIKYAISRS